MLYINSKFAPTLLIPHFQAFIFRQNKHHRWIRDARKRIKVFSFCLSDVFLHGKKVFHKSQTHGCWWESKRRRFESHSWQSFLLFYQPNDALIVRELDDLIGFRQWWIQLWCLFCLKIKTRKVWYKTLLISHFQAWIFCQNKHHGWIHHSRKPMKSSSFRMINVRLR